LLVAVVSVLFAGSPKVSAQSTHSVSVAWDPSPGPNIAGYVVHYGTAAGNYSATLDAGTQTSAIVAGLQEGMTYYFVVTAYDDFGVSSDPSNEASYQVPSTQVVLPTIALTSPITGTGFTAPAIIALAADVTANGHSITKVQFYSGSTLLGESTGSPYTFTWSGVGAGDYSVSARLTYDSGSTIDSAAVAISVAPTPVQWQIANIGNVSLAGNVSSTGGTWTVTGAGTLGGTSDNFSFPYQTLTADGELRAQISSAGQTGSSARVGIMIRETLASGAKCVFLGISPDGVFRWQRRNRTGNKMSSTSVGSGLPPNAWVRLVRTGNTIDGYTSPDGVTWSLVGSQNVTMASSVYFGLAVASGSATKLNTTTFSNVLLVP
jgi:hypothetical protein